MLDSILEGDDDWPAPAHTNKARRRSSEEIRKNTWVPGSLRGGVDITLHTIQGVQLLLGRRHFDGKVSIPGLYRFSNQLEVLAAQSAVDDPYADWCLIRIERDLAMSQRYLERQQTTLEAKRDAIAGLSFADVESHEPVVHQLRLQAAHAFLAAQLIATSDRVISTVLTLFHVGQLDRWQVGKAIGRMKYRARRPFWRAHVYRPTGITRKDVRLQHKNALDAAAKLGDVPLDIVTGELKPRFALPKSKSSQPSVASDKPDGIDMGTHAQTDEAPVSTPDSSDAAMTGDNEQAME